MVFWWFMIASGVAACLAVAIEIVWLWRHKEE